MKPLIIANWKCNPPTLKGAKLLFNLVKKEIKNVKKSEIVICPPFVYLSSFNFPRSRVNLLQGRQVSSFKLGAQDCFWEEKGAFTGEISPLMLKDLGCRYVIIGHSERRKYLKETDEIINKKLKAAIKAGLNPILCVGETEEDRKASKTSQVVEKQLKLALKDISNCSLIIAYEPIWAIGTGNPCSWEDAKKANLFIRKTLNKILNKKLVKNCRVIYGGSINSQNASQFITQAKMEGLLIGGVSLNPKEFIKIIKSCEALKN